SSEPSRSQRPVPVSCRGDRRRHRLRGRRRRSYHPRPPAELYTLSLHDALPIFSFVVTSTSPCTWATAAIWPSTNGAGVPNASRRDRKSTRLNSSHVATSYAVFCLKKKIHA